MTNISKAIELIAAGRPVDAYDACPQVIHHDSLSKASYLALATALWRRRRYAEAERILEIASEKHAEFGAALDLYDRIRADRSTLFQIHQTPLSERRFHIDSLRDPKVKKGQLGEVEIRGWVELSEPGSELLVQQEGASDRIEKLSIQRPDVVRHFKSRNVPGQLPLCGFSFKAKLNDRTRISLRSPSGTTPVVDIFSRRVLQVLEGRDGWLFLNNDSNRSADLFTGKLPASKADAKRWTEFARETKAGLDALGIESGLVIAPAKEDVFLEFHPLVPAKISLLDTIVSSIFLAGVRISCPVRHLRQEPASYYRTDTHWSDLGGWVCVQDILSSLGLQLPETFSPAFHDVEVIGDLGSRIEPARRSIRKVWSPPRKPAQIQACVR